MRANVMVGKSVGVFLAVIAVVGLSLISLTIPTRVEAQDHPTAQGTHPVNTGAFKTINGQPDTDDFGFPAPTTVQSSQRATPPSFFNHQAYFNSQSCGSAYSPSYDPFFADSIDAGAWGFPIPYAGFDGTMGGSDLLAWYGYNAQAGWWSPSPYALALGPAYDWCPGFEGWLPYQGW
jgi:hypothetical protein